MNIMVSTPAVFLYRYAYTVPDNVLLQKSTLSHKRDQRIPFFGQHQYIYIFSDWQMHSQLTALQPVSYPKEDIPASATGSQLPQENTVRNRVKGFVEVQVDYISSLFLIIEGDQVGQARTCLSQTYAGWPDCLASLQSSGTALVDQEC